MRSYRSRTHFIHLIHYVNNSWHFLAGVTFLVKKLCMPPLFNVKYNCSLTCCLAVSYHLAYQGIIKISCSLFFIYPVTRECVWITGKPIMFFRLNFYAIKCEIIIANHLTKKCIWHKSNLNSLSHII